MMRPPLKRLLNRYSRNIAKKQQSRCLTVGEIALARSVFGDSIRLDEVRLKTTWWVLKSYAVSPNGN
ncbi:MAG TPA: type IV secretion protein Rhs, partial [Psychrobacter sp.]|nr:type IV secretion protein Rhs [Psychrobacter sp.]